MSLSQTHTNEHRHTHIHTCILTFTRRPTRPCTDAHPHSHAHVHTHAHSHAHRRRRSTRKHISTYGRAHAHLDQHLNRVVVPPVLWQPPRREQRLDQTLPTSKRLLTLLTRSSGHRLQGGQPRARMAYNHQTVARLLSSTAHRSQKPKARSQNNKSKNPAGKAFYIFAAGPSSPPFSAPDHLFLLPAQHRLLSLPLTICFCCRPSIAPFLCP